MIGIGGVAMGTLAAMLRDQGYNVCGSDAHIYPPMSDMLEQWGIPVYEGYDDSNIKSPDLVIIGNVISRGNPEAEHVLNENIPYCSMAQALYTFFLSDKEVICVAGTHGKTTTTALISHILTSAGHDPSFLVGGVPKNYNSNYCLGTGDIFVIEGDEYDSAFFEKIPKFILYRPQHLVLTSLEFDHADIYNDLDEITRWFIRLVNIIPERGSVLYSGSYPVLKDVVSISCSKTGSYGSTGDDISYTYLEDKNGCSVLRIDSAEYGSFPVKTRLFGAFNFENITAAVYTALVLNLRTEDIQNAVASFLGVKRRQELIYESAAIKIYEDFAHHPTSIRLMLRGVRTRYPGSHICAVYEPRSATSRRNIFQDELGKSFIDADSVCIKAPYNLDQIPPEERIDIRRVVDDIVNMQKDAAMYEAVDDIIERIFSNVNFERELVIVIMSNGGFDGIYTKCIDRARSINSN